MSNSDVLADRSCSSCESPLSHSSLSSTSPTLETSSPSDARSFVKRNILFLKHLQTAKEQQKALDQRSLLLENKRKTERRNKLELLARKSLNRKSTISAAPSYIQPTLSFKYNFVTPSTSSAPQYDQNYLADEKNRLRLLLLKKESQKVFDQSLKKRQKKSTVKIETNSEQSDHAGQSLKKRQKNSINIIDTKSDQSPHFDQSLKKRSKKLTDIDTTSEQSHDVTKNLDDVTKKKSTLLRPIGKFEPRKILLVTHGQHYLEFCEYFADSGWTVKHGVNCHQFDMMCSASVNDINFDTLRSNQIVNHFPNSSALTIKFKLMNTLRNSSWYDFHCDFFFPKSYNLFQNDDVYTFIEDYFVFRALSVLLQVLNDNDVDLNSVNIKYSYIIANILLTNEELTENQFINPLSGLSAEQWCDVFEDSKILNFIPKLFKYCKIRDPIPSFLHFSPRPKSCFTPTHNDIATLLRSLSLLLPQFSLLERSVFILKPGGLSRGRGIVVARDPGEVLSLIKGSDNQLIVQKYLEKPLLINSRKFDIRQWVLVSRLNGLEIYIYEEFYVRLCGMEYDMSNTDNKFIHLTNFAIQKDAEDADFENLIWEQQAFLEYLISAGFPDDCVSNMYSKFKDIIRVTILSAAETLESKFKIFEMFGFDFMIDEELNAWLIEVNAAPTIARSTSVNARLVAEMMEATAKFVLNNKQNKWKTVYKEGRRCNFTHLPCVKDLKLEGVKMKKKKS
ncbi:hypothetical protein GEMRC1_005490 [Eukaryota sp. GEM-RC1]